MGPNPLSFDNGHVNSSTHSGCETTELRPCDDGLVVMMQKRKHAYAWREESLSCKEPWTNNNSVRTNTGDEVI